jgi:hypothetical protein
MTMIVESMKMWFKWGVRFSDISLLVHLQQVTTK